MQPHQPRYANFQKLSNFLIRAAAKVVAESLSSATIDLLDDLEFFKSRGIGLINASPLALGLLTNQVDPPDWHIAPDLVKQCVKKAAKLCQEKGEDLGT